MLGERPGGRDLTQRPEVFVRELEAVAFQFRLKLRIDKNEESSPHPLTVSNLPDKNKKVGLVYQMGIVMGITKLRKNEERKRAVVAFELAVVASLRRLWPPATPRPPRFLRRPVQVPGRPLLAGARRGREGELLAT